MELDGLLLGQMDIFLNIKCIIMVNLHGEVQVGTIKDFLMIEDMC